MNKKSKYGRNPKLNPKTHCVMVRFDDVEWNRFLTMYKESQVYAKAVFLKAHFFGQKFKVLKVKITYSLFNKKDLACSNRANTLIIRKNNKHFILFPKLLLSLFNFFQQCRYTP